MDSKTNKEIDSVLHHLNKYGNTYVQELKDEVLERVKLEFGYYDVEEANHEMGGGYIISVSLKVSCEENNN